MYRVGTSKHWQGATVFWQIAADGEVRGGKIMLYDRLTGHRVQEPFPHINWVHSVLKLPDFKLTQCFFGEHLLPYIRDKPVAIVESEKTAILATFGRTTPISPNSQHITLFPIYCHSLANS